MLVHTNKIHVSWVSYTRRFHWQVCQYFTWSTNKHSSPTKHTNNHYLDTHGNLSMIGYSPFNSWLVHQCLGPLMFSFPLVNNLKTDSTWRKQFLRGEIQGSGGILKLRSLSPNSKPLGPKTSAAFFSHWSLRSLPTSGRFSPKSNKRIMYGSWN